MTLLKTIRQKYPNKLDERAVNTATAKVDENLKWLSIHQKPIETYFQSEPSAATQSFVSSFTLIIAAIFVASYFQWDINWNEDITTSRHKLSNFSQWSVETLTLCAVVLVNIDFNIYRHVVMITLTNTKLKLESDSSDIEHAFRSDLWRRKTLLVLSSNLKLLGNSIHFKW